MKGLIKVLEKILGTLGWGILGGVLLYLEIGPWWVGWLPLAVSTCVIVCALDGALSAAKGW